MLNLYCPRCLSELEVCGHERLETLDEHVMCVEPSIKAKLRCSNIRCLTRMYGIFWNENGELYSEIENKFSTSNVNHIFIDRNDAPFGSFQRRLNVEIGKKDENYTLLKIGRIWLRIKFSYESNENGDILRRNRHLEIWLRDRDEEGRWEGYTYYHSGLRSLIWVLRKFYRSRRYFLKDHNDYQRKELIEFRDGYTWDKRWWRKLSQWWMRNFHYKLYKQLTTLGN